MKARRTSLGLSQGAMIRALGYVSRNSISNVETGREGLPPKRVYAWADLLRVPRDAFFRFVMGESLEMSAVDTDAPTPSVETHPSLALAEDERALLETFRALTSEDRAWLRARAEELLRPPEAPAATPKAGRAAQKSSRPRSRR